MVYNVRDRRLISEIELGASPKVLTVSADNRQAFLTNPIANSVSVVNINDRKQQTTFQTERKLAGISWAN